ncbi:hypothetical protein Salat_2603900 [Sesamum alatum]|uniref:Uncharacterized protein n=1 Tax=Sesamum alatum TaxID=300844 RepID=A0AAE1XN95_9LAMI|nr:hypothetical protein Salat_2603900 [Sesamum alatum]
MVRKQVVLGSREEELEENMRGQPTARSTEGEDDGESLGKRIPDSPKYARVEDIKALIEEAAERRAQAALRWMKEREITRERSPSPQNSRRRERENSVGSSHAPQSPRSRPPKEAPPMLLEDPRLEYLRKDVEELRKQIAPGSLHI